MYKVEAEGFRSRFGRVGLAPSGLIVAYEKYGPPDEAAVMRENGANDERRFFASVSEAKEKPVNLVIWTVRLDPNTGRAADITVQPLRADVTVTAVLKSSKPEIGIVDSPLTIPSGANHVVCRFTPLGKGETVITINTPPGFATPANATSVPATVSE
jgi:hypothetical protein